MPDAREETVARKTGPRPENPVNLIRAGHGPKDIEKTIDMNWMGMVKGATLHLTVHNKNGWGEFDG